MSDNGGMSVMNGTPAGWFHKQLDTATSVPTLRGAKVGFMRAEFGYLDCEMASSGEEEYRLR